MRKSTLKYLSIAALFCGAILTGLTATPDAAHAALAFGVDPQASLATGLGLAGVGISGMIMDERLEFADAVSVAAAAGTALIGDVIDLTTARDMGNGQPVYLVITTDTEIITGGVAGTINFALASDAQAAIATDGSATSHFTTRNFVTDDDAANDDELNAGGIIAVAAIPLEGPAYERYLGILATVATTTVTAGNINAFLTLDPHGWSPQADASN